MMLIAKWTVVCARIMLPTRRETSTFVEQHTFCKLLK